LKVAPLTVAARRTMILFLISIAYFIVSAFVMLGEDVYWKFAFVDLIYANIGTNPSDVWVFFALGGVMAIWAIGLFWVIGCFDEMFQ
jgi:hypothetical protein